MNKEIINPENSGQGITDRDDSVISVVVVDALRQGEHKAFEKVYVHYRKPLVSFVYRLVGEQEKADGIVQDVFADLWEKRERIDPSKSIKSYLFTIAKRTAFKHIFKKGVLEEYTDLLDENVPEYTGIEDLLEAKETQLLIDLAVSNMPKLRREIFTLYRDGDDVDTIAAKLNIKKENVYNHLSRARSEIRELLTLIAFFMLVKW